MTARGSRRAALACGPLAAMAACAGPGAGGSSSGPGRTDQPVALTYLTPGGTKAEQDTAVFKQYHTQNSKVTVTVEIAPSGTNFNDKVFSLAAASSLPDIVRISDGNVKPYALQGVSADMDKLAAKDKASQELLKDVYPNMLALGRFKSTPGLYMLPWALDVLVTYYNKTMFQAAGVELPKPDWTVEAMIEAARRLTKSAAEVGGSSDTGGEPAQFGVLLSYTAWAEYVPWMRGYGGDMLSPDGKKSGLDLPGTIEGIEAMTSLRTRHKVAPPPGYDFGGGVNGFVAGRVGMTFAIRNLTATIRNTVRENFEWDVQLRPAFPRRRVGGMGTQGVSVTTQTKHPDVAWDAAKYTIMPEGQRIYAAQYGAVPVLQSMRNDAAWRNLPAPPSNVEAFIKAADYGTLPPDFPDACGTVYIGDVNLLMTQTLTDIVNGKVSAASALRDAASQINACMAKA